MLKRILNTVLLSSSLVLGLSVCAHAQKVDITEKGGYITTSFAPQDNAAERAGNLIDNNTANKMYAGNGGGGAITFLGKTAQVANGYSIVSANDSPDRDLMSWKFQGSNDGNTWVTLDDRSAIKETFPDRFQKKTYSFANTTAYKYYRWYEIQRNGSPAGSGGTGSIQLAEIEILADNATGDANIMIFGGRTTDQYNTGAGSTGPEKGVDSYIFLESKDNATAGAGGGSRYLATNHATTWLRFEGNYKSLATSYAITSQQNPNSQKTDPKNWTLSASNDTTNWTVLDTQTDQAFTARAQTKTYTLTNTTYYKNYKLEVTANNGDVSTSIGEWQLDGTVQPPTAPTALKATAASNSTVNLTWTDNSSNEDNFVIQVSKDQSNWFTTILAPANVNSYTVPNLSSNIRYYFRLYAQSEYGKTLCLNIDSAKTIAGGTTYAVITDYPGILTETYNSSGGEGRYALLDQNITTKYSDDNPVPIWIQWYAVSPAAVDKYTLTSCNDNYRGDFSDWTFEGTNDTSASGSWTVLDTQFGQVFANRFEKHTYTFTNTTRYSFYRINITGSTKGTGSDGISMADMEIWGTSEGVGGLFPPTNLKAEQVTGEVDRVYLTWADNSPYEDNYVIEQSLDGNTWTKIQTVDKNTTEYIVTGLEFSTQYFFRVYAVNADGPSTTSNVADITTPDPLIAAPSEAVGDGYSKTATVIAWKDNSIGEDSYEVDRSTNSLFTPANTVTVFSVAANKTNFIDTGLTVNTSYYYRVRAISALYNNSDYTPVITATTYKDLSGMALLDTLAGVTAVALIDGNAGEGIDNILDGNPDTKYNTGTQQDPPMWVEIDLNHYAAAVTSYVITSGVEGSNTNARDPYEWTFEGSNDGLNWDILHDLSSTPQDFVVRKQDKQYSFPNTVKYNRYRLNITAIKTPGSYWVQLSDLKLYADKSTLVTGVKETFTGAAPKVFALSQNYPNPFNPTTNMHFTLEKSGHATVKIYNVLGAEVATLFNGHAEAGKYYQVTFDASKLSSGIYIARIESGAQQMIKKLVLMK